MRVAVGCGKYIDDVRCRRCQCGERRAEEHSARLAKVTFREEVFAFAAVTLLGSDRSRNGVKQRVFVVGLLGVEVEVGMVW